MTFLSIANDSDPIGKVRPELAGSTVFVNLSPVGPSLVVNYLDDALKLENNN